MEKADAKIKRNNNGEVVEVDFDNTEVTDAGLADLKRLTKLQMLRLSRSQVTDSGLVHLLGLTNLQRLYLSRTQVTRAGIGELKQALPNCRIIK